MSFDALAWAARQKLQRSADKLILLGLAESAARGTHESFPSIAALVEFSSLDRKTVITALDRLEADELIKDTGVRVGRTRQVKVYRLNLEAVPKSEPLKRPENTIPKTEPLQGNSTVFPSKESRKRNTEPVREPESTSEDKSSSVAKRKGTHLPEDWQPSEADIAYARSRGLPDEQIRDVAEDFRTYWTAGKGRNTTHLNWSLAWQSWVRKERPRTGPARRGMAEPSQSFALTPEQRAHYDKAVDSW